MACRRRDASVSSWGALLVVSLVLMKSSQVVAHGEGNSTIIDSDGPDPRNILWDGYTAIVGAIAEATSKWTGICQWGNHCGGSCESSLPAIDDLDAACRLHDCCLRNTKKKSKPTVPQSTVLLGGIGTASELCFDQLFRASCLGGNATCNCDAALRDAAAAVQNRERNCWNAINLLCFDSLKVQAAKRIQATMNVRANCASKDGTCGKPLPGLCKKKIKTRPIPVPKPSFALAGGEKLIKFGGFALTVNMRWCDDNTVLMNDVFRNADAQRFVFQPVTYLGNAGYYKIKAMQRGTCVAYLSAPNGCKGPVVLNSGEYTGLGLWAATSSGNGGWTFKNQYCVEIRSAERYLAAASQVNFKPNLAAREGTAFQIMKVTSKAGLFPDPEPGSAPGTLSPPSEPAPSGPSSSSNYDPPNPSTNYAPVNPSANPSTNYAPVNPSANPSTNYAPVNPSTNYEQIGNNPPSPPPSPPPYLPPARLVEWTIAQDTDLNGGDLPINSQFNYIAYSVEDAANYCAITPDCEAFTWEPVEQRVYLKYAKGWMETYAAGMTSGVKVTFG